MNEDYTDGITGVGFTVITENGAAPGAVNTGGHLPAVT